MTIKVSGTTVEILGKPYQLKCNEEQIPDILRAAEYVEEKMKEIRDATQVLSIDRLAIITALNISHELLVLEKERYALTQNVNHQLEDLQKKMDDALLTTDTRELFSAD